MRNDASCPCEGSSLVGFIQPIILSLLGEGPCHGYILMQNIGRTRLWKDNKPDAAGVYRALKDMEARGLIRSQAIPPARPGRTAGCSSSPRRAGNAPGAGSGR